MTPKTKLDNCYESIKDKLGGFSPKIALILGSGLGALADEIDVKFKIDYHEIDGFPTSTVPGHKGRFVFGCSGGAPLVVMQGRVHYYEGYSMDDVVLPVRLMRKMGAEILFLTNASGGINPQFVPGDFMLINDQIASFVPSPLNGPNIDELGPRFPDMSAIYDKKLISIIRMATFSLGIDLKEGVYIQTAGPNFESPAEIRMYRMLGADAVGMSTACEAVAGNHAGMRVCGISSVVNMACGMTDAPLSHEEVIAAANNSSTLFRKLILGAVEHIAKLELS